MKEIIIKVDEQNSSAKGSFYEALTNNIFKFQRYIVQGNVNFTGMEFDLLCKHLDRTNETVLVECKAKDKLKSEEITKFAFNVGFKKYNYGYFLFTKKFGHQVAGLIEEFKNDSDKRYENLYFWDATKVIELLIASGQINELKFSDASFSVTKTILLYSYFGNFYVAILSNSTIPTHFSIFNAKSLEAIHDDDLLEKIKLNVPEIQSLKNHAKDLIVVEKDEDMILETVAEIQESESWYDYKPASSRFFVGRKKIETDMFDFFGNVLSNETKYRVFYLDGKSGWGKSSFLNEIKGRSRNKHFKNKYFTFVVDSRSANSQNFIALAFKKMLDKAIRAHFIDSKYSNIEIQSLYNILQSEGIDDLSNYLIKNKKSLILIFDQFEDVFRKGSIFTGFYKLLLDIIDLSSNIILGFSWKAEVNIPIDHRAYHLWQQAKDQAKLFSLDEFDLNESKKIVKQLEKEICQKLDSDFIRKIIDNSQGFPWLVKKLCVHIFEQTNKGISNRDLYNQDFNVELLFKDDEEKLTLEELKALKFVAQRAFDNNMLDEIEINDCISPEIRNSLLLEKKMIIKTGTKYNIYWDIFRDYLVTEEIPKVGETYILRQQIASVYEMFQSFKDKKEMTIDEILNTTNNTIAPSTAGNLLRELRTIGLVIYEGEKYILRNKDIVINEESFKMLVKSKLVNHSFYLELQKITEKEIELEDVVSIIKMKIKSQSFADKTLSIYAQKFISWIDYAGLSLPNLNSTFRRRAENSNSFTPQNSPIEIIKYFKMIEDDSMLDKNDYKLLKVLYDLKSLGFLIYEKNHIIFTKLGTISKKSTDDFNLIIIEQALKMGKIKKAHDSYCINPEMKKSEFKIEISELLEGIKSKVYVSKTNLVLYNWAKYIYDNIK